MKMHCRSCGCHFDNDFEETLQPECTMWRDRGFPDSMAPDRKKALWDAYFSIPVDEIADETGVITQIDVRAHPGMVYKCNEFEMYVPNYKFMTDAERRAFQKRLFKFVYNQPHDEKMRMQLQEMGEWDDLVATERENELAGVVPTTDVVCMSEEKRSRIRAEEAEDGGK